MKELQGAVAVIMMIANEQGKDSSCENLPPHVPFCTLKDTVKVLGRLGELSYNTCGSAHVVEHLTQPRKLVTAKISLRRQATVLQLFKKQICLVRDIFTFGIFTCFFICPFDNLAPV